MSLWTVQQHEWLQALGHPVLLLAGDPSLEAPPAPARERERVAAAPDARVDTTAKTVRAEMPSTAAPSLAVPADAAGANARRPAQAARPAPPIEPTSAPDSAECGPPRGASRTDAAAKKAALEAARGARRAARPSLLPSDDVLLLAILRASGMEAPVFEVAAQAWRIDLVRLRAEPAAKRALWQQMRKARRNANG